LLSLSLQFLGRDLLAAKFNINKMLNDGVIKGDPDVIMNEVLQGLEDFAQGKIARLPDRDLVILGEKRPARGQPLQDKVLRQYAEENAPTTARDPEHKRLKDTVNQFNLGTLMAISEGKTKASPMQQVPGQEGLMFANPTRVDSLSALESQVESMGVDVTLGSGSGDSIVIHKIVTPKENRGQGVGTDAMNIITDFADSTGRLLALTPSTDFGASSVKRLKDFYKRFGFVENKGRNKDFSISESMIREPVSP